MANITRIKASSSRRDDTSDDQLPKKANTQKNEENRAKKNSELENSKTQDSHKKEKVETHNSKISKNFTKLEKAQVKYEKKQLKKQRKLAKKAHKKPMPKALRVLTAPFRKIGTYIRESWQELRQVRWPNRKMTWKLVSAVIIYTVVFAVFIMLLDAGFTLLFNNLLK